MKWLAALVVMVGCKYPDPGGGIPADDQPPDDANVDDSGDAPDTSLPPCVEPMSIDNMVEVPGKMVAGFMPTEDESFAISWLSGLTLGYTESPLGESYMPTDIPDSILFAKLSGDGNVIYFIRTGGPTGQRVRRAMKLGANATWSTAIYSGFPDGAPGRPTSDDQRMFFIHDTSPEEWERVAGTWTMSRGYEEPDWGHEATAWMDSANLSHDGNLLLYTITDTTSENGIWLRVRSNGTFDTADGSYGRMLAAGTYRDPVFAANCTKLYVYNKTTQHAERWDVHP